MSFDDLEYFSGKRARYNLGSINEIDTRNSHSKSNGSLTRSSLWKGLQDQRHPILPNKYAYK